jgi:hypothetical protein
MKALWSLAVAATLLAAAPGAGAQTVDCMPACLAGETCVGGVCMVPAPRASEPPEVQAPDAATPAPDAAPPAPPVTAPPPAPPVVVAPPPPVRRAPRPPVPEAIMERQRGGLVVMPFVGMHSFQDEHDSFADPGLRAGAFVGRFINNSLSLNGAATFDLFNPNDALTLDLHKQMIELTFSPLLHMGSPRVEFIVGPKAGVWNTWTQFSGGPPTASSGDGTTQGWTLGANVGLLGAVTPRALAGVILDFAVRDVIHACATAAGRPEACAWSGDSQTLLGVSFAVLL